MSRSPSKQREHEPVESGRFSSRNAILRAAHAIPEGFWTAYGEIGLTAGTSARAVGRCASSTADFPNAWRVIHADGSIPDAWGVAGGSGPERCRRLLEAEGIGFVNGRADPAKKILADELELLLSGAA